LRVKDKNFIFLYKLKVKERRGFYTLVLHIILSSIMKQEFFYDLFVT